MCGADPGMNVTQYGADEASLVILFQAILTEW